MISRKIASVGNTIFEKIEGRDCERAEMKKQTTIFHECVYWISHPVKLTIQRNEY